MMQQLVLEHWWKRGWLVNIPTRPAAHEAYKAPRKPVTNWVSVTFVKPLDSCLSVLFTKSISSSGLSTTIQTTSSLSTAFIGNHPSHHSQVTIYWCAQLLGQFWNMKEVRFFIVTDWTFSLFVIVRKYFHREEIWRCCDIFVRRMLSLLWDFHVMRVFSLWWGC